MQDYHREYAEYYDLLTGHKDYEKEVELLLNFIWNNGFNSNSKILSIGCGIGKHEHLLASHFKKIVGIDKSPHMIEKAKSSYQKNNIEFICCDLKDLKNENFDIVISLFNVFNCIKNLKDLSEIMNNVKKLINKKSIFVFELWNKEAIEKDPPKIITREYKNTDIYIKRIAKPIYEIENELITLNYEVSGINKKQSFDLKSTHKIYLHSNGNIEKCLRENNFVNVEWYSSLSDNLTNFNKKDRMLFCKSNSF
tara:strand:- start:4065 stop:4820 length:756 start_codon:yes stop_codon:yes gene_type:complete